MPIEIESENDGRLLIVHLSGTLQASDYDHFLPIVNQAIQNHGKVRMLVEMQDFHGWSAGALWQDIKFDAAHFNHFERLAMVGDQKWQEWMVTFCRPFTTASIQYFPTDQLEKARQWVNQSAPVVESHVP